MAERRVSVVSLVTGLLSLGVAALYLLHRSDTISVDEYVVFASTIVALGVGGVVVSVYGIISNRRARRLGDSAG